MTPLRWFVTASRFDPSGDPRSPRVETLLQRFQNAWLDVEQEAVDELNEAEMEAFAALLIVRVAAIGARVRAWQERGGRA